MITAMRKGVTGWAAKILFVLLILSFGAWGIVDYLQPDPDPVVISVGDTDVRQSWVRTQFNVALDRLRQRLGSTVTQDLAVSMGLDEQVIDSIVDQQVLTREAQSAGLQTSDGMLRSAISQDPNFQGVTGQFDRALYQQTLFRSGLTEGQFLQDLSGRLLRDPLIAAAVSAPPVPKPIVDTQYRFFAETRQITLAHKAHSNLDAPADPGDGVLRAFYDDENQRYQQPELRDLSAVILSPEAIAKGFAVADARIAEEYEARRGQYTRAEERTIDQILFQDATAAADAVSRLRAGETWEAVKADAGGVATELGSMRKSDIVPGELADPAFAMAEAGYSDPIQSPFGHHVLWVKAIDPAEETPLEAVREELRQSLALDLAVDELIDRANRVEDVLAAGDNLEAAADAAGMPVSSFAGVGRTGIGADGKRVEGLPTAGQFLAVGFQTEEGETSILTETPNGGYFVVRVDRIVPTAKKPFEQVREQVLADWIESQRADQAKSEADALAESLRAGGDAVELAEAAGFEVALPGAFNRTELPPPTTPDLVEAVFKADKDATIVHNDADRVFVAVVAEITPPAATPAEDDENAKAILQQLTAVLDRDRRQELARAFQESVRARYDVEIDREVIDRLLR